MYKLPLIIALVAVGLTALSAEGKTYNPRAECLQKARQGGSPGGTTVTDAEKENCNALPNMEVTEATLGG